MLLPGTSWQRRQPGEAKPVWGGPALLPQARGTGALAGQGPTAWRTPGSGGMPGERGRDARGPGMLFPTAQTGPGMPSAAPSLPAAVLGGCCAPRGSRWLRAWRLPPLLPPCFLFFPCFSSPNREARWTRTPPFPAAFGRGPGRPLAPPAARSLLPPQLGICFGAVPGGSLPAPDPLSRGAGAAWDAVPESPLPKGAARGKTVLGPHFLSHPRVGWRWWGQGQGAQRHPCLILAHPSPARNPAEPPALPRSLPAGSGNGLLVPVPVPVPKLPRSRPRAPAGVCICVAAAAGNIGFHLAGVSPFLPRRGR